MPANFWRRRADSFNLSAMQTLKVLFVFSVLFLTAVFAQETPKTDETLEYLKKVDGIMFNYPDAGVHSLTMKMKIGENKLMPAEMREKLKDAALVYYWRQEPWAEALDVVGVPPEMAAMKQQMLGEGVSSMRKLVAHSRIELAKHYQIVMEKDGELVKLHYTAKEGKKEFPEFTQWHDKLGKLVKGLEKDTKKGTAMSVEFALQPFATKYAIAEWKQGDGGENPGKVKLEYGKSGELPVIQRFVSSSGPFSIEFPMEMELNPKHEASVFGGK